MKPQYDGDTPRLLPPMALLMGLAAEGAVALLNWPISTSLVGAGAGLAIALAGAALTVSAAGLFRRSGTGVRPFSEATLVVAEGPYRFTRNPMYLGMTLILLGVAIMTGKWVLIAVPGIFAVWVQSTYIVREEAFMAHRFGEDYEAFRAKTPRWLGPI